jgi:hypothetical protein
MRNTLVLLGLLHAAGSPVSAQSQAGGEPIEIPLRVEGGRLMVSVDAHGGEQFDFVLSLGMSMFTEAGAAGIGDAKDALTVGGIPFSTEGIQTVPNEYLAADGKVPAGMVGSVTLNAFDILIDVPNERLVLRQVGRSVTWPGVPLSNPVSLRVFHGTLASLDVEVEGVVYRGLLDFQYPELVVNEPVKSKSNLSGDTVRSYRMGYVSYSSLPFRVRDLSLFEGWDPDRNGFVVVGAAAAYDCAIAVSFAHQEMRTCKR